MFASCEKENMGDCFKSTGKLTVENRTLPAFQKVNLDDRINMTYVFSQEYKVVISAGENLMDEIKTEVKNGELIIRNENRCNWVRSYKKEVNLTLYAPDINAFDFAGSGKVTFQDTLKTASFRLNLFDASGSFDLLFAGNYIELKSHTGPGDITARGSCRELIAYLNGNGQLNASGLSGDSGLIINQNTGDIQVNLNHQFKAEIRGAGNIYYLGNPEIRLDKTASGKLIKQ
jgi:hypothetical protein